RAPHDRAQWRSRRLSPRHAQLQADGRDPAPEEDDRQGGRGPAEGAGGLRGGAASTHIREARARRGLFYWAPIPAPLSSPSAVDHSARTSGSASSGRWRSRSAAKRVGSRSRESAQTAAPRTSGDGSASSPSTSGAWSGSPALPSAISTLRTNRSRPVRLIGEPEKIVRKAASSSVARSARRGAVSSARGRKANSAVREANLFQGQT